MNQALAIRRLSEFEIDRALQVLRDLEQLAAENVQRQGRDRNEARVLLSDWREALAHRHIWGQRFRILVAELERRRLVHISGPFVGAYR